MRGLISYLQFPTGRDAEPAAWPRPPRAPFFEVAELKDEPGLAAGFVRRIDVRCGVCGLARNLRPGSRTVVDVEADRATLAAHPRSGVRQGAARGRDVLEQDVDGRGFAAAGRRRADRVDVDAGACDRVCLPRRLARRVVHNDAHVFGHRVLRRSSLRCLPDEE
jgi:hypothetical protein